MWYVVSSKLVLYWGSPAFGKSSVGLPLRTTFMKSGNVLAADMPLGTRWA